MPGSKRSSEIAETEQLTAAVRELAQQVEVLRNALDEIRSVFAWAVRNDKLRCPGPSAAYAHPPASATIELDEQQLEAMTKNVTESIQDLAGDLEGAVRDGLKEEFANFRDSVDQFSLDVQFAARRIHEKPAAELSDLRETLQGEIVDLRGSLEQFMIEIYDAIGVAVPVAIAEPAAPTPNQELEAEEQPEPKTDECSTDLQWLSRKAFTASAAVAHAAQSERQEHPPSQPDRQRSFF